MRRRQLLVGFAGLSAAGSTVIGTGAFTSVTSNRTVTVAVKDDDDAFLTLDPSSDFSRSTTSDGQLEFYIPGLKTQAGLSDTPSGEGIGPNSTYTFGDLLMIKNMGSDPVEVFSKVPRLPDEFSRVSLVDSDRQVLLNSESAATELSPGASFSAGLLIESGDSALGEYDLSLEIRADPVTESESGRPVTPPQNSK